jgi:fatty acid desaturase
MRLLLSPFTFLHPRLRAFVLEHMSSYVINFRHRLTVAKNAPRRAWAALEIACSLRLAGMFGVVLIGIHPPTRIVQLYFLAVFSMLLNYIRNLVAHRYENTGGQMTHAEQLADSITITGHPILTELFFPVGLRYHALHHLFPGIPYHNLGIAHRRLMARLPADSPYRQTVFPSYLAAARTLWANARPVDRTRQPVAA